MTYGIDDDPRDVTRMLAGMNSNIPVDRRSLMDYIENGDFSYRTKSGGSVEFGGEGIEYLASVTDDREKLTLRLPIFVSTDASSERGSWKIDGRTEVAVVSRILNRRVHSEDRMPVYHPDLAELKKRIPGLVFMLFLPRAASESLRIYLYDMRVRGYARCVASCGLLHTLRRIIRREVPRRTAKEVPPDAQA